MILTDHELETSVNDFDIVDPSGGAGPPSTTSTPGKYCKPTGVGKGKKKSAKDDNVEM